MTNLRTVRVRYHFEDEGWWAESEDLRGWTAVGKDFDEVRAHVRAGIPGFIEEPVSIVEEGVPASKAMAGVWMPLSGTVTTPAFAMSFDPAASLVPVAPRSGSGVGQGRLDPDEDLDGLLVHGN